MQKIMNWILDTNFSFFLSFVQCCFANMAFNIPILVIALVSETLKRERIRSMMQEINAKNWGFVDGIDGKKLEKKSGNT